MEGASWSAIGLPRRRVECRNGGRVQEGKGVKDRPLYGLERYYLHGVTACDEFIVKRLPLEHTLQSGVSSRVVRPLVRKTLYCDEILGQFQSHHQLPNLRTHPKQLPVFLSRMVFQSPGTCLQELPLPAFKLVHGHLTCARDAV